MNWWEETVFYEIYMPSFNDSNQDGIGDFRGITGKIDYLKELGIGGIWLTPYYPSPKVDNGYDISDYFSIDPIYGNWEDFNLFIKKAHDANIRVIVDLVVNHTSDEHPWFIESRSSHNNPKRDWYIWRKQPNNWESFFGGSAWTLDENTKAYYYHSFSEKQVDLNWTHSEVKQAIFEVIDFWIDKGIDGFRLDVINNLSTSCSFKDNPYDEEGKQIHLNDVNQPGILEAIKSIEEHVKKRNSSLFTVGEISSDRLELIEQYAGPDLLDVTFNFNFGSLEKLDIDEMFLQLKQMKETYQENRYPTLFFGSHDMPRFWNRLASKDLRVYQLLAALLLTSRGVPFIYYGDELGTGDFVPHSLEEIKDIQAINRYHDEKNKNKTDQAALLEANKVNRDRSRASIQWWDKKQDHSWIGFAKKNPDEKQIFQWFKQLLALRKKYYRAIYDYQILNKENDLIYYQLGEVVVLLNFGKKTKLDNKWGNLDMLLSNGKVQVSNEQIIITDKTTWIGKVRV